MLLSIRRLRRGGGPAVASNAIMPSRSTAPTSGIGARFRRDAAVPDSGYAASIHVDGTIATLRPRGELDIATAPDLDADLAAVRDLGFASIVVDLRDLRFVDSSGVQLFVRWATDADAQGVDLTLVAGPEPVHRVFRLSGLLDLLRFADGDPERLA
jgi:anti-sigma B factor antagonist